MNHSISNPDSLGPKHGDLPASKGDAAVSSAYLVLQNSGRWSDVFRLSAAGQAILGRASSNHIVIRSDQASRRHARIAIKDGGWAVEDLGSRNGTYVNGRKLDGYHALDPGDVIEVAGYSITFTHRIDAATGAAAGVVPALRATDDQVTMEIDLASITERRQRSVHLHSTSDDSKMLGQSRPLLHLAFAVARCDEVISAVEKVLDSLGQQIQFDTAGIYVGESLGVTSPISGLPLVATRQSGTRSYRRPPVQLMESVGDREGHAILARNVIGDGELATENSRGEMDVESVIVAPVRDHENRLLGLIHLTTTTGNPPLASDDLELVVATGEILAESLAHLLDRQQLSQSLKRSRRQISQLQQRLGDTVRIIGSSESIGTVVQQIGLVAPTNATVLIRGESGVGKELVAAAIHHSSPRKDGPLVCLNCAALSPALLESELFGHEKGAFTGATERKRGKFEMADGGTLMLDEVGEMSAEVQAKFLRVLEGHPFERVGGQEPIRTDVRVVAATNRNLQQMVSDGQFRHDLYYRLHVVEIVVPPLRDRGKDCLLLAEFFLRRFNAEMGRKIVGFTDAAKQRLTSHAWPGNIRELKNVIERAVVFNTKAEVHESDLMLAPASLGSIKSSETVSNESSLADLERAHIERVLRQTEGNKSRAAAVLGIERSTLDRKLKKFSN